LTEKHSAFTPFDFSRLDRVPKALLRAVHHLHENFAKNVSASLAAYLRTHIAMSVVSMEQISYAEFIEGMAAPTLIAYIGMPPYEGTAVMELNTSVVFNMLETLLGGGPRPAANPTRKVTEVEKELMQSMLRILLRGLRDAWATVVDVEFEVQFLADDPYGVRVMSPTEAVVAIGIEAQIGHTAEVINIAIPSIFVKATAKSVRPDALGAPDRSKTGAKVSNCRAAAGRGCRNRSEARRLVAADTRSDWPKAGRCTGTGLSGGSKSRGTIERKTEVRGPSGAIGAEPCL
jgi:flagellar motor switch protein FliM